jgi:tripartite-type tricarboxylate transporter receptor subunit TctC
MQAKTDFLHRTGPVRIVTLFAISAGFLATVFAADTALAQEAYPTHPISLIAPYSVGGDADLAARNFAVAAQLALGQPVVVLNKTGASGILGSAYAIASPPDGYTLLLARTGSQAILPAIQPNKTRYKWDQYTFVSTLELNPYGCLVNSSSKYHSFKDLVDEIRTKGKSLNYGTAGVLTTNDMGPRLLFKILKVGDQAPTEIPYRGTGEAAQSLLANQTDFSCGSLGSFLGFVQGGELRVLMVTTSKRLDSMPDVPTARELGYAEMEGIVGWSAVLGPPDLPTTVRDKLAAAIKTVSKDPAWLAGTARTGSVPYILSPDETKDFVGKQYQLYQSLGESLGLIDTKP